jgi:hypothetical protein
MKRIFFLFSVLLSLTNLRAENTNENVGAWSDAVGGLRGRLVVAHGQKFSGIDYVKIYVELQNVSDSISQMEIYPFDLKCALNTSDGKPAKQVGEACGGPIVLPIPLVLPFDSTIRVNVSYSNCTSMQQHGGTFVYLGNYEQSWAIDKDDHAEYFLEGTFHLDNPGYSGQGRNNWFGTLKFPKVKIPRD